MRERARIIPLKFAIIILCAFLIAAAAVAQMPMDGSIDWPGGTDEAWRAPATTAWRGDDQRAASPYNRATTKP